MLRSLCSSASLKPTLELVAQHGRAALFQEPASGGAGQQRRQQLVGVQSERLAQCQTLADRLRDAGHQHLVDRLGVLSGTVPPMWVMRAAKHSSTGRARSSACGFATDHDRELPFVAPSTPPETGASMKSPPTAPGSAAASSRWSSDGRVSTTTSPGCRDRAIAATSASTSASAVTQGDDLAGPGQVLGEPGSTPSPCASAWPSAGAVPHRHQQARARAGGAPSARPWRRGR